MQRKWTDHEGVSSVVVGPFLIHLDQPRPNSEWRLICPNIITAGPVNLGVSLPYAKIRALELVAIELKRTLLAIDTVQ